ncbi:hypothetical protein MBLNU459_g1557t3 [Dothideomycetes sp. NU459]
MAPPFEKTAGHLECASMVDESQDDRGNAQSSHQQTLVKPEVDSKPANALVSASPWPSPIARKRRASRSPERGLRDETGIEELDSDLPFRKRRSPIKHSSTSGPSQLPPNYVNPLYILADAAASAPKLRTPTLLTIPAVTQQLLASPSTEATVVSASCLKTNPSSQGGNTRAVTDPVNVLDTAINVVTSPSKLSTSASSSRSLAPIIVKRTSRRVVLLSSPIPSPLAAATKFNILAALMSHVDILLNITSYLSPTTLLNLYSISAPFHYLMDSHFTSFIMACTRTWAPNADRFFPWWCYRQLCIEDPAQRRARTGPRSTSLTKKQGLRTPLTREAHKESSADSKARNPDASANISPNKKETGSGGGTNQDKTAQKVRDVPSFRWLKMVAYRESVSREIIGWLAYHGHRVPRHEGVDAVKKMWFLLDMPISAPRVALIHNSAYFTPATLVVLQTLFVKLDMLYTDPVRASGGEHRMREMLLAERSLTTLWNYLRGADGTSRLDVVRLWVRHGYKRPQPLRPLTEQAQKEWEERQKLPIMGVPALLVGRWGFECWGLGKNRLIRPDELVAKEGVRRRLGLQREYMRMVASGYLGLNLEALPVVKKEDVVLSLIRRRKNQERNEREQLRQDKGKDKEQADGEREDVAMAETGKGEADAERAREVQDLQKLVMLHLTR